MYPSRHYHVHKHDCTWRKFGIKCLYELPQENVLYNQQILTMKIYLEILFHLMKMSILQWFIISVQWVIEICLRQQTPGTEKNMHRLGMCGLAIAFITFTCTYFQAIAFITFTCTYFQLHAWTRGPSMVQLCLCSSLLLPLSETLNRNFWDGLLHYLYLQYLHDGGNILPLKQSTRGLREGCMLDWKIM
jgi:hypothetical protein